MQLTIIAGLDLGIDIACYEVVTFLSDKQPTWVWSQGLQLWMRQQIDSCSRVEVIL